MTKRCASISLDLDNQWSYMKTHGDAGWESFPTYLDTVVPRVLEFLRARDLKITFFIVGQDAALEKNRAALGQLAPAGHEIGNHSFNHEPWLHLYSPAEIETEFQRAEDAIEAATGQHPTGFRGPGFSLSRATLETLVRRGYAFDASTFPTYLGPLARAYYFMTAKLDDAEREKRKGLFGKFSDGWQSVKPYRWQVDGTSLTEIPVTTMPGFKVPMHVSYIIYLSAYSPALAMLYFKTALSLCRLTGTEVSMLLHPLDFLGAEDVPELKFFPGMNLGSERKMKIVGRVLDAMAKHYELMSLGRHAKLVSERTKLPTRKGL
jgi:peptidoglycan/xylan/chitin deacetylase (PgdA/CDA1 family)